MREVFVTGLGIASGIGCSVAETLHAFRNRESGVAPVSLFETRHEVPVSEVKRSNAQLAEMLSLSSQEPYTRTALLGMYAAKQAMVDAQLTNKKGLRIGLISSTSVGGMDRSERFYVDFRNNKQGGHLSDVVGHDCGDSTKHIAEILEIHHFSTTISTACSSGANAIILGARMVKAGLLDCAVVGGTDSLCRFTLNGFSSLMILDKQHCRPFDVSRQGLNLGEGAAYLVLQASETLEHKPYCRIAGYANANDAYHQTASSPDGNGAYLSMSKALSVAGLIPSDISYLNAHGTGTESNDFSEGIAIKRVFGDKIPPFSSTKPFTGHTLGASGAIEAVFSALSIKESLVLPNLNFQTAIPELGLVPQTQLEQVEEVRHVMSNSFGFGGSCSSLIFSA